MGIKKNILSWGARLPPALKTKLTSRVLGAVQRRFPTPPGEMTDTNLGIAKHFHIHVPSSLDQNLLYGTPRHYRGESGALHLAAALAPHSQAMLDVGANHGYFTFYVAHETKGKTPIYYFEPNPALFSEIQENISRNQLGNIQGFELALGAKTGQTSFWLNKTEDTSSSLTDMWVGYDHEVVQVDVQVSTYADLVRENKLDRLLVKVDVEGAEDQFLAGALRAADTIEFLIMEVLGPAYYQGFLSKIRNELRMKVYYIDHDTLTLLETDQFEYNPGEFNWLFCRHSPDELSRLLDGTTIKVVR